MHPTSFVARRFILELGASEGSWIRLDDMGAWPPVGNTPLCGIRQCRCRFRPRTWFAISMQSSSPIATAATSTVARRSSCMGIEDQREAVARVSVVTAVHLEALNHYLLERATP
jgi:hypothetical protein